MIVGVVRETFPGERRVALSPAAATDLQRAGLKVRLETGAGAAAGYLDEQYVQAGAEIAASRDEVLQTADLLARVRALGYDPPAWHDDRQRLRWGQIVVGMCDPLGSPAEVRQAAEAGLTAFGLELIPRTTRAQNMDVLSSMNTVAGYRAVILAAAALPKMFPLLMTAAGTLRPARVFVVGAGVAGLQAISTARRLGAVVEAYDVRPAVKEQVESLGAKFVELPLPTGQTEAAGGYARQMDEDFYRRQRELMLQVVARQDVVITTALVPGRPAPQLITEDMVRQMPAGGVIVDLAAERGGNCALTQPDQTVVAHGATILGPTNPASDVPLHASQMYAKNMATFLQHLVPGGQLDVGRDDEILRETLLAHDGRVVNPRINELLSAASGN